MDQKRPLNIALWLLLLMGFFGAARVSYANLTGDHCPHIWVLPICYLVLAAYGLMMVALLVNHNGCKHYFFCAGWGIAFAFALVGSVAEVVAGGGVCPVSGGGGIRGVSTGSIPMCFVSLALTLAILILFLLGPYKRACDVHNAKLSTKPRG